MSRRRNHQNGKKTGGNGSSVESSFVRSTHAAASGDIVSCRDDLIRRSPNYMLSQRPPKNFLSQPHWIQCTFNTVPALNAGGTATEATFAFSLNLFLSASAIVSLFDQYCIYMVSTRAFLEVSTTTAPTSSLVSFGRVYSALDFDSSNALGSEAIIQRYSTVQVSDLVHGKSYERNVKPVVGLVTGSGNSTTNSGVALNRLWINSAFQQVPHYGIRYMFVGNQSATTPSVQIQVTAIIGLRNNI